MTNTRAFQFHNVSQKDDIDVARYNFDIHQPIWIFFAEMILRK